MTKTKKSLTSSLVELVAVVAIAVGLAIGIQAFVVKPYRIPSASMFPTLHINQRVLVNRLSSNFSSPHVGDIIVFHPPTDDTSCADPHAGMVIINQPAPKACDVAQHTESSETFIKRVVGLPGDKISIRGGHVIRNGVRERDGYTMPCFGSSCNFPATITIPRGEYFMMGDNRPDSDDSRFWGPVRRAWIIGKAFMTYWPPDRIGFL